MSPITLLPDPIRIRRRYRAAMLAGAAGLAFASTAANADCTADASGLVVTCTGASTGYSNLATGVSLSAELHGHGHRPDTLGKQRGRHQRRVDNEHQCRSDTSGRLQWRNRQ